MLFLTLWLITIAVMDWRLRKVRNWMVLLGLGMGLAAQAAGWQWGQAPLESAWIGMLAAFAALLPFYALRWMGAGDVKCAAVLGLWFGGSLDLLVIWLGASLLAGLHGLLVLLWRRLCASAWGPWLQARAPLRLAARLSAPAPEPLAPSGGPRRIQRSIPYAGYMALVALWLLLARGPAP